MVVVATAVTVETTVGSLGGGVAGGRVAAVSSTTEGAREAAEAAKVAVVVSAAVGLAMVVAAVCVGEAADASVARAARRQSGIACHALGPMETRPHRRGGSTILSIRPAAFATTIPCPLHRAL